MEYIINALIAIVSVAGGYYIARWQFNEQKRLELDEKKFLKLYRPYFSLCEQKYNIDVIQDFSEFDPSTQEQIISLLCEYDYLATKQIQSNTYTLVRFSFAPQDEEITSLLNHSFDVLHKSIVSEYERICKSLGYNP